MLFYHDLLRYIIIIPNMIQKKKTRQTDSQGLSALIQHNPVLKNYFSTHSGGQSHEQLAVELMLEAIKAREHHRSPQAHYNVAMVKHKRYLSPSQKRQVTHKVTQVVPVGSGPVKIYGKPKAMIDNSYVAVETQQTLLEDEELKYQGQTHLEKTKQKFYPSPRQDEGQFEDTQVYLSPKHQHSENKKGSVNKPKKQPNKALAQSKSQDDIQVHTKPVTMTPSPSNFDLIHSPVTRKPQDYNKVQSRIKDLIDRDKNTKKLEKMMEQQSKQLSKLEKRQQHLQKTQNKQTSAEQQALLTCHCEYDQIIDDKIRRLRSERRQVQDHHQRLYSNLVKMRDNTYKINAGSLYPLSSSSDSLDSSQY